MPRIGGRLVAFSTIRANSRKLTTRAKEKVNNSKADAEEKKQINDTISEIEKFFDQLEEEASSLGSNL